MVSASTSLVFGDNDRADIDKISCNGICSFGQVFTVFLEMSPYFFISIFFYFVYNQYKGVLYFRFSRKVYILGFLGISDSSIYKCDHWF